MELLLWKCNFVAPSKKPVRVIDLGNGEIRVIRSVRIRQPRDAPNESYHDSYEQACQRHVENSLRDILMAKAQLKCAERRLKSAKTRLVEAKLDFPEL